MLYSIYAIYASGGDAVLGGTMALGVGFLIWGFIAPRFSAEKAACGATHPGGVTMTSVITGKGERQ